MERSSAILSGIASSMFCPAARPPPLKLGFRHGPALVSSRAIAAAGTAKRSPERGPTQFRSADRWHLMENASSACLDAVRKAMPAIRQALGAIRIEPTLLSSAERLQYEGFLRREEIHAASRALADRGIPIKEIVRRTGCSRQVVRRIVRGERSEVFRVKVSSLEPWLARLDAEWAAGCRNGAELWRRLKIDGFKGSLRVVTEWATRRRRAEGTPRCGPRRCPSSRVIARMMTSARDQLSKEDAVVIATVEAAVPALVTARTLFDRFQIMICIRLDQI
jgi:transposase